MRAFVKADAVSSSVSVWAAAAVGWQSRTAAMETARKIMAKGELEEEVDLQPTVILNS